MELVYPKMPYTCAFFLSSSSVEANKWCPRSDKQVKLVFCFNSWLMLSWAISYEYTDILVHSFFLSSSVPMLWFMAIAVLGVRIWHCLVASPCLSHAEYILPFFYSVGLKVDED